VGGAASLQRSKHGDAGAKAPLKFAGQGKGLLSWDRAQHFDGFTAAAQGGGDALVAIGLDANCCSTRRLRLRRSPRATG
jgi:hypothetical protein